MHTALLIRGAVAAALLPSALASASSASERRSPAGSSSNGGGGDKNDNGSDPNMKQLSCSTNADRGAKCNVAKYCGYTYNNFDCAVGFLTDSVSTFHVCAADADCGDSGSVCVDGLCCAAEGLNNGREGCPTREEISNCCFELNPGLPGHEMDGMWQTVREPQPHELLCGCPGADREAAARYSSMEAAAATAHYSSWEPRPSTYAQAAGGGRGGAAGGAGGDAGGGDSGSASYATETQGNSYQTSSPTAYQETEAATPTPHYA